MISRFPRPQDPRIRMSHGTDSPQARQSKSFRPRRAARGAVEQHQGDPGCVLEARLQRPFACNRTRLLSRRRRPGPKREGRFHCARSEYAACGSSGVRRLVPAAPATTSPPTSGGHHDDLRLRPLGQQHGRSVSMKADVPTCRGGDHHRPARGMRSLLHFFRRRSNENFTLASGIFCISRGLW